MNIYSSKIRCCSRSTYFCKSLALPLRSPHSPFHSFSFYFTHSLVQTWSTGSTLIFSLLVFWTSLESPFVGSYIVCMFGADEYLYDLKNWFGGADIVRFSIHCGLRVITCSKWKWMLKFTFKSDGVFVDSCFRQF